MPELPEVETIRRGLLPCVLGESISNVRWGDPKVFQFDPWKLQSALPGQKVMALTRRGKYLCFRLEHYFLIVHLGMTGQLTLRNSPRQDPGRFLRQGIMGPQRIRQHGEHKHTHLEIRFRSGLELVLRDPRKFGKVFLLDWNTGALDRFFLHLGMEPLSDEYELGRFVAYLGKRKARIKSLLLDQGFVAGIGNIYADEALFLAGIHPARRVRYLRKKEKEQLYRAIPVVLEKGISYGGTSLRDYVNSDGEPGSNQEILNVYGREGQACLRCGATISKIVISQRGTHFCPVCQKRR